MRSRQKEYPVDIQIVDLEIEIEDMEEEIMATRDENRKQLLLKNKEKLVKRLEGMKNIYNWKPIKVPINYDSRLLK